MRSCPLLVVLSLCALPAFTQNIDATLTNGVNGYIDVPADSSLVPAKITVEAWVYFNNVGLSPTNLFPTILRKNVANSQEEYFMRVEGTGSLRWKVKTGATTSVIVNSPGAMPGNTWTHVAGTYDGTTSRLFMNGVQVASANATGTPFNGGGALRIGKGDDQSGLPSEVWSGQIDELRLWSVARTAAQIQGTMNLSIVSAPGLVSTWQMEGSGADSTGSNHGTVVGAVAFNPSSLALTPGTIAWQPNTDAMSLDIDGASSDGYAPAIVTAGFTSCTPASATFNINMSPASLWDLVYGLAPPVAADAGGLVTPAGQIVNMNLTDPTMTFLFAPGIGAPVSNVSFPLTLGFPIGVTVQGVAITAASPEGFALSSAVRLEFVSSPPTPLAGPTADDQIVTVALANPALCGAPSSIPFYGSAYTTFDVSSNGRVLLGVTAADNDWTPTVAEALTDDGFVGAWCDLSPNTGGTIQIGIPSPGVVRVDYTGVRYFTSTATATFGIVFDANSGIIMIDGLTGMTPHTANQFLGITLGNQGATNAGATVFAQGGPFSLASPADMIYAFGAINSLSVGLTAILFIPNGLGGYDWAAF